MKKLKKRMLLSSTGKQSNWNKNLLALFKKWKYNTLVIIDIFKC